MKIRIITIHGIPNFGSVFQSYALCEYLKSQNYLDVEIIDYNPTYFEPRTFRAAVGKLLNYKHYRVRSNKFREFNQKYIPLTKQKFKSLDELKRYNANADVYIAGGDQLWNIYHACGNDDAYKLTFAAGKKISYATSLGQTDFSQMQLTNLAQKLRDFSAISVRESSSVALLKKADIHASHCVDPVFLLNEAHYNQFVKPVKQPKYLLVYLVTPSNLLEKCIDYLAKKYQLKVILCSGFSKKCSCDEFLKDLGPDEILSYIKNAEIVLSSSFHATAFSLIFKKQFFTILPDRHTNERIIDLLVTRGLENRIISEQTNLKSALNQQLNYENLKSYDEKITESMSYLKNALR